MPTRPTNIVLSYPAFYREAEAAAIARAVQRRYSVFVCGAGGSGKSHLLRFVAWHEAFAARLPFTPLRVYVDCNAVALDSAAGFFRALGLELGMEAEPAADAPTLLARLRQHLAEQMGNGHAIIALDRIERLPEALQPAIFDGLRHLRDYLDRRASFLLGCRMPLPMHAISVEFDDLLATPPVVWVGPLAPQDAHWSVAATLEENNATADAATIETLAAFAGRLPRLMRAATLAWLDTNTFHAATLLQDGQVARICAALMSDLPEHEQTELREIASGKQSDVSKSLAHNFGFVQHEPDGWHVRSELLALYARSTSSLHMPEWTGMELQLWELLQAQPNKIVERETLLAALYGDSTVSDEALTALVARLRRKLGEHKLGTIEALRGRGYRFVPSPRTRGSP